MPSGELIGLAMQQLLLFKKPKNLRHRPKWRKRLKKPFAKIAFR